MCVLTFKLSSFCELDLYLCVWEYHICWVARTCDNIILSWAWAIVWSSSTSIMIFIVIFFHIMKQTFQDVIVTVTIQKQRLALGAFVISFGMDWQILCSQVPESDVQIARHAWFLLNVKWYSYALIFLYSSGSFSTYYCSYALLQTSDWSPDFQRTNIWRIVVRNETWNQLLIFEKTTFKVW
jgi:hypothetical protein